MGFLPVCYRDLETKDQIVLHRVKDYFVSPSGEYSPQDLRTLAVVDTETTGMSHRKDEVIEIAIQLLSFHPDSGEIVCKAQSYESLQEPSMEISEEVQRVTGLNNEMLKGQAIDWFQVDQLLGQADLVIAHNAGFDRPFIERYSQASQDKIWACSFENIDWFHQDFLIQKQEVLLMHHGYFYEAHRAMGDVQALSFLLSMKGQDTRTYLRQAMDNIKRPKLWLYAFHSPFESKDLLREHSYRWDANMRVWKKKVTEEQLDEENQFLEEQVYQGASRAKLKEIPIRDHFKLEGVSHA